MEGRKDVKLQSLVNVVGAMGGEVEVRVRFAGGEMPILISPEKTRGHLTKNAQKAIHT